MAVVCSLFTSPIISAHSGRYRVECGSRRSSKTAPFSYSPRIFFSVKRAQNSLSIVHLASERPAWSGRPNWSRVAAVFEDTETKSKETISEPVDIVILTNGPGEVATWVKPVVASLRQSAHEHACNMRISVVLSPCPHASGGELQLLQSFDEIDRCQGPDGFLALLLLGKTKENWDWRKRGACIFLGGDQFSTLVLGYRLGYKTLIYAEDTVRWPGLVDAYSVRSEDTLLKLPHWARIRCQVVGDLFSDAVGSSPVAHSRSASTTLEEQVVPVVGLLPGSKDAKLAIGVPYFMAVAENLHQRFNGQVRFVLPLAPTVNVHELQRHANCASNPMILRFNWVTGHVIMAQNKSTDTEPTPGMESPAMEGGFRSEHFKGEFLGELLTQGQVSIEIWQRFPPYSLYQGCTLCLTTVGTNTAELGSLGVPMLVVLPTYALENLSRLSVRAKVIFVVFCIYLRGHALADFVGVTSVTKLYICLSSPRKLPADPIKMFRGATGGILGLLAAIPGSIGATAAHFVNLTVLKTAGFISWPNRWAKEEIVPELIGRIEPEEVAAKAAEYLKSPKLLQIMHDRLLSLRKSKITSPGYSIQGAAHEIAETAHRLLQS